MIDYLCKELIGTYDTNILDNESQIVQRQFLDVSRDNRNNTTNFGKKVLMKLIYNHYSKRVNKPILNTPKNCLDMRNIKQPLFSYKRYDDCAY